jgi:hypothetical protein
LADGASGRHPANDQDRCAELAAVDQLPPEVGVAALAQPEPAFLIGGGAERRGNHRALAGPDRPPRSVLGPRRARHHRQRPADRIAAADPNQAPVELGDLDLEFPKMGHERLQQLPSQRWNALVLDLAERRQQLPQAGLALRRDDPELGEMSAQGVEGCRPLTDQLVAHPAPGSQGRPRWSARRGAEHQGRLLDLGLDRHEAHARPWHARLAPSADHRGRRGAARATGLRVGGVVLVGLDVGFDTLRRHKPSVMAERSQFTRPAMRAAAGLEPDHAARQVGEEGQHLGARQPLA